MSLEVILGTGKVSSSQLWPSTAASNNDCFVKPSIMNIFELTGSGKRPFLIIITRIPFPRRRRCGGHLSGQKQWVISGARNSSNRWCSISSEDVCCFIFVVKKKLRNLQENFEWPASLWTSTSAFVGQRNRISGLDGFLSCVISKLVYVSQ